MKYLLHTILLAIVPYFIAIGQPTYNIADGETVTACEGTLIDSGAGVEGDGFYDHNENYTFTLCTPDAVSIALIFTQFNTEIGDDILTIYGGSDVNSPIVGTYSGPNIPPPFITLENTCLTFQFTSDASVASEGFSLTWTAEVDPISPLGDFAIDNVPCFATDFIVNLPTPITCSSVTAGTFTLLGPNAPSVSTANPIGCDSDGLTNSIAITLGGEINRGGNYSLIFDYTYIDICGQEWPFSGNANFNVVDCPLFVDIEPLNATVCNGGCVEIFALATGGDLSYTYTWTPTLSNMEGPHEVCPTTPTTYTILVTDGTGATAETSTTIQVNNTITAGNDISVCLNEEAFPLVGTPVGGYWFGAGVDGNTYYPHYDNIGVHWIYYDFNGCIDSLQLTLHDIWAGWDEAACTGSSPFTLIEPVPNTGGNWSGNFIDNTGVFTPSTEGNHELTYTDPLTGCSDTKIVNVSTITLGLPPDISPTMCQSTPLFTFEFSPFAGWWEEHAGFENTWSGEFDPAKAGSGVHTLTYHINGGCSETITIEIIGIDAGGGNNNTSVYCPEEGIVSLNGTPTGGTWATLATTGSGLNTVNGTYDTGWKGIVNSTEFITYTLNGCVDTLKVSMVSTRVENDYLEICPTDERFRLNWDNVMRAPGGGDWLGAGVEDPTDASSWFDPALAFQAVGSGEHTLYYTRNGCTDSLTINILPIDAGEDISICADAVPFNLPTPIPAGGIWYGEGLLNEFAGTFDPSVGFGNYLLYYEAPSGCYDSLTVFVSPQAQASFQPIDPIYCFKDTSINLIGTPNGGTFSGIGVTNNIFNPSEAGEGAFILTYTFGIGECATEDQVVVNVSQPLGGVVSADTSICQGDGAVIFASGFGGTNSYTFTWNNGIGFGSSHLVQPLETTTYTVTIEDGCSNPSTQEVTIFVNPAIEYDMLTSEPRCFGEIGFAKILVPENSPYIFQWETGATTDSLVAEVGFYDLTIIDTLTNCQENITIDIPKYSVVHAEFTTNPNTDNCITSFDLNLIDYSVGGVNGTWNFGDSSSMNYGNLPIHSYASEGNYTITLTLANEGGCQSTFSKEVCIEFPNEILVPTAFSPNGDDVNDVFFPTIVNPKSYEMVVYDRWGKQVFASTPTLKNWDGYYQNTNKKVPMATYVYWIKYNTVENEEMRTIKGNVLVIY